MTSTRPPRTPEELRRLRNARQRRCYARKHPHRNEIAPNIEINDDVILLTIDTGSLSEVDADDRQKIAAAVSAMLKDAGRQHRQKLLTHAETRCPHCGRLRACLRSALCMSTAG